MMAYRLRRTRSGDSPAGVSILVFLVVFFLLLRLLITRIDSEAAPFANREFNSHFLYLNQSFPIARKEASRSLDITIIVIVDDVAKAMYEYSFSLSTLKCYAASKKYAFKVVAVDEYINVCPQKDFMFRRHCVVAEILNDCEWVLYLDADAAVVNPDVLIEEYIDDKYDLTLYDRFTNWEVFCISRPFIFMIALYVAAGSYIVRNTPWTIKFLMDFANFESFLPQSFHGTDNGAIHVFLQRTFFPHLDEPAKVCLDIWSKSNGWDTLYVFEACIRSLMGDVREFEKTRILKKGSGWMRDIWLTDSHWCKERDFILHGLKDSYRVPVESGFIRKLISSRFVWKSPIRNNLSIHDCSPAAQFWDYEESLMVSREEIEYQLRQKFVEVERSRWRSLSNVARYI